MKEKNLNERKAKTLTIVSLVLLIVMVIGAAYAYFAAQVGNGTSANINATTGTTDVLTFSMQDIDAGKDKENVTDENSDEDIIINASEENFGKNEDGSIDDSLADGVKAVANLKANDANGIAVKQTYNVYLVIDGNELPEKNIIYSQDDKTPELLLNVQKPNSEGELTTINGLKYYNKEDGPNNFSGFDITDKHDIVFEIAKDYGIEVKESDEGEVTQEWQITVTFINLDKDQNKNAGKELHGKIVMTKEEAEGNVFKLTHISSLKDTEVTTDSITTTLNIDEKGSYGIESYYFGYKEIGQVETVDLEDGITWSESQDSPTYKYTGLKDNTNYQIYAYTIDSEGFQSNLYDTEIVATEYKLPEITSVEVTEITTNSISVEVKSTKAGSSGVIEKYKYQIKTNGEIITDKTVTKGEKSHTFEGLDELTEYEIIINAIDSNNKESAEYKISETTRAKLLGETCQGQEMASCFANNYKKDNALIYHDVSAAQTDGIENYDKVAGDDSYRYSGADKDVKNYVCLDGTTTGTTCADDDLYRIIGLFKNASNQYEIKVIKSGPATNTQLGTNGAYKADSENTYYWNKNQNDSGTNTNKWGESNLNTENLNKTFKKYIEEKIGENKIVEHTWIVGGNTYDNIIKTANMKTVYTNEITNPNVGSYATETDKTYTAKIGLMYASDYGYAVSPTHWTTQLSSYNSSNVKTNNWMYMNNNTTEWTISRNSVYSDYAFNVSSTGFVGHYIVYDLAFVARPVFYLASSVTIASGNGSTTAPYRVS